MNSVKYSLRKFQQSRSNDDLKKYEDIFKKFKIRPCLVKLPEETFSKIHMKCSAKSDEKGVKLSCILSQDTNDINTFTVQIKRKLCDESENQVVKSQGECSRLRPRKAKVAKVVERSTKLTKTIATLRQAAKPKPCDHVEKGQIVLCKMKGFCEWPAIVTGFENNLIKIEFFGDHTTHKAAVHNFYRFEESYDLIACNLRSKKTPLYSKSIREAEKVLGIPNEKSIFNTFF